jgi:hypothetical protein
MALVPFAFAFSGATERLTGAASAPDRFVIRPSGKAERERPATDAGEEMAGGVAVKVGRLHEFNGAFVNVAFGDVAGADEFTEPGSDLGVKFIVVVHSLYQRVEAGF